MEGSNWYMWQASCFKRTGGASAAMKHDDHGNPCGTLWYAWPPFIEAGMEKRVLRRGFRSPESAMKYADTDWPAGVANAE